ncbi:response regulator transcription factor [Pantanalinema rosaneae]|uniref:response regulator transcription factor n=1 Tax=Pantanalinema rosaneae TaxID=1620701 RepID=UPI003D6F8289
MNTQELSKPLSKTPDVAQIEQDLLVRSLSQTEVPWKPIKVLRETAGAIHEVIFELRIDETEYYVVRRKHTSDSSICLSPREMAIAQLIAQGLPNKTIGRRLAISPCTVSTYLRRIFMKLGVTSRAAMVARLMQENVLPTQ